MVPEDWHLRLVPSFHTHNTYIYTCTPSNKYKEVSTLNQKQKQKRIGGKRKAPIEIYLMVHISGDMSPSLDGNQFKGSNQASFPLLFS